MNREMISYNSVLLINKLCLLEREPFEIVDKSRILSAIGNQFQPYPNLEQAFASVYKSLVINHGFLNGNKRTGVITLFVASVMLGSTIKISDKYLCDLTYKIASEGGSYISVEEIANMVFGSETNTILLIKDVDIEKTTTTFIENHGWLMNELAN